MLFPHLPAGGSPPSSPERRLRGRWTLPAAVAAGLLGGACATDPAPQGTAAQPGDAAVPDVIVSFDGGAEPDVPHTPRGDAPAWDPNACDLRWTYTRPEGGLPSPLSVDEKGNVYATGAGVLHRITPAGTFDWVWPPSPDGLAVPGEQLTGAAVNGYGTTIVLAGESGRIYAVTHLGGTKWTWDTGARIRATPALAEPGLPLTPTGGLVAAVTDAGLLVLLRDEGSEAVPASSAVDVGVPGAMPASVTILDDGTLRVRTEGRLTAVTPQGEVLWTWAPDAGGGLVAGPAVGQDGTLRAVVGHGQQTGGQYDTFALATWSADGDPAPERALGLADDRVQGLVTGPGDEAVLTTSSRIQAWSGAGDVLWTLIGDFAPGAPPALSQGGLTAVGAAPHTVLVLDEGGAIRWRHDLDGDLAVGAPVVGDDGTTYLHLGPHVVAIHCGSAGPAASRWPRYQGSARSTGRPSPLPQETSL